VAERPEAGVEIDVVTGGLLFADLVFSGLDGLPVEGEEVWSRGLTTSPGGIANFAVAIRRLGHSASLAAAIGDDTWGGWCWAALEREGVDLSRSRRFPGWSTPLTVAMSVGHDRALLSHATPPPVDVDTMIGDPPTSRAAVVHLGPEPLRWVTTAAASGALVFAEVGWDPSQNWTPALFEQLPVCHAFVPNEAEAMSYTRTTDARSALRKLADAVPLAVITRGAGGALGLDSTTGETAEVAGLSVEAVDPTGAGDVFTAGLITGTLGGWPLHERLAFANLCAALSVRRAGGAASAPRWADVRTWWDAVRHPRGDARLRREYAFLDDVVPAASDNPTT